MKPISRLIKKVELPPLPRTTKKREASITPKVLDFFRHHKDFRPCFVHKISDEGRRRLPFDAFILGKHPTAIEIKVTDRKYISENAVLPHQKLALADVKLSGASAYVVAVFLHPDERIALVIDAKKWAGAIPSTPCEYSFKV